MKAAARQIGLICIRSIRASITGRVDQNEASLRTRHQSTEHTL
jgi:hypothetical protein